MLNSRDFIKRLDMRGTLAFDEDGVLGIILTPTKVGTDPAAYEGRALTGGPWSCAAPTQTFGTVKEWDVSGDAVFVWLKRFGVTKWRTSDKDSDNLARIAREEDLL